MAEMVQRILVNTLAFSLLLLVLVVRVHGHCTQVGASCHDTGEKEALVNKHANNN